MAMLPIVQNPTPPLRRRAAPVEERNGSFAHLKRLCDDMRETMRASDGIGIAAPQVGEPLRIFIVETASFPETKFPSDVFINARITKTSFKKILDEEGCLSAKNVFGLVMRHASITIEAYTLEGKKIRMRARDLLARVFQHEMDHCEGVLFIDKAQEGSLHSYTAEKNTDTRA